jgi:hypothetical protein
MNDAGSLQNLNDIVMPGPAAWWPLAPGWYVLLAILVVAMAALAIAWRRQWLRNGYRRQAMLELSSIRATACSESPRQLPALLTRAALAAWPRGEVASLNGRAWHRFLDRSAAMDGFCSGAGDTLDQLAYAADGAPMPGDPELEQVLAAAEFWLKNHMRQARDD